MKSLSFFLLMIYSFTASAAAIEFHPGQPEKIKNHKDIIPFSWLPKITISGEIKPGDEKKFELTLNRAEKTGSIWDFNRSVWLDSYGGDTATAISISYQIRKHRVSTIVMDESTCASACILILAGGTSRLAQDQAKIGLHRPYFSNTKEATKGGYEQFKAQYENILSLYRTFFTKMGIRSDLVETMTLIPSNEIRWINREFANQVNLLGDDPADTEWVRAKRIEEKGIVCVLFEDEQLNCYNQFGVDSAYCDQISGQKPQSCKDK